MNVEVRPPFNVFYMGLNPTNNEKLKDLKVRQAIYHAINREQLVQSQLPEGATVATQFVPDTIDGYNAQVEAYAYDPDKAKSLLQEAGAEGMTLKFAWPAEVTRPYMPNPQGLYDAIKADLEAVGIQVETLTDPWGTYLDKAYQDYDAFFLGWTGDFNSVDNFLASFFTPVDRNRFATNLQDFGQEPVTSSSRPTASSTTPSARPPTRRSTARSWRSGCRPCRSATARRPSSSAVTSRVWSPPADRGALRHRHGGRHRQARVASPIHFTMAASALCWGGHRHGSP